MLEHFFPHSFRIRTPLQLALQLAGCVALPLFIGYVGGLAGRIPYVRAVMALLTAIVALYCVGSIVTTLLYYFGRLH